MTYACMTMPSPVGKLTLIASEQGLAAVLWENDDPSRVRLAQVTADEEHPVLLEAERQLGEYFAGERQGFDLPLDFRGTDFQQQVWQQLLAIPFGTTRSYGEIARAIRRPSATRAVGGANGRNPISIMHRAIA